MKVLCLSILFLLPLGRSVAFLFRDPEYLQEEHSTYSNQTHYEDHHSVSGGSTYYHESESYQTVYETSAATDYDYDRGALLLTPYIEEGRIKEGREAALVSRLLGDIQSYSGYFTVNEEYNSNLFFWYFPAEETSGDGKSVPVVLWLNGGPGVTSLYGLLYENGPIVLKDDNTLAKRSVYWSKHYHMIYVDNPVGVGFSFTDTEGLVQNETQLSKQMHTALVQFFQLFPHLSKNKFFVAGESYAGRYVPSIAYEIHMSNPTSKVHINLKGVMIGNGLVDIEFFGRRGVLLAQLGLIDLCSLPDRLKKEEEYLEAIENSDYDTAHSLMFGDLWIPEYIVDPYNYLNDNNVDFSNLVKYFSNSSVRYLIHVGNTKFAAFDGSIRKMIWNGDGLMETSPYIERLLEHYRVLYYNGQLDLTLPYPNCEEYADKLNWSGASEYRNGARNEWSVGGKLAGFSRVGGNLTLVLVRDAGHMVPMDQPERALDLITKFINDQAVV